MNNPNDYLVGLDIGSHKVLCVVALPSPKGEGLYRICGYSFRDSHGVRNGIVTDLNAAVDDIKAAVREALRRQSSRAFECLGRHRRLLAHERELPGHGRRARQ